MYSERVEQWSRRGFLQALVTATTAAALPLNLAATPIEALTETTIAKGVRPLFFTLTHYCNPVPYDGGDGWLKHIPGQHWTELELRLAPGTPVPQCGKPLLFDETLGTYRIRAAFLVERVEYRGDYVEVTGRSNGDVSITES